MVLLYSEVMEKFITICKRIRPSFKWKSPIDKDAPSQKNIFKLFLQIKRTESAFGGVVASIKNYNVTQNFKGNTDFNKRL